MLYAADNALIDTIGDILSGVFGELVEPLLRNIFNEIVKLLGSKIWEIFSSILMDGFILTLKLIHFLEQMFNVFSGVTSVSAKVNGATQETTLVSYIFGLSGISKALFGITLIAAMLAFLFAIYATGKSMSDMSFDDKATPITTVIRNGIKSAITFMIVPFICVFLLQLSTVMLKQVVSVFDGIQQEKGLEKGAGIDDTIFISCAQNTVKTSDKQKKADIIKAFSGEQKYKNKNDVKKNFNIDKIEYLPGFISCIFIIFVLLGSVISFIRRVFDLLVLYLVSPFFSASIALDGGAHFKKWKDMFIAQFFSGFGSVFAMKLFLIAAPVMMNGSKIAFTGSDDSLNQYIKIFLIMGGAWAVYKGQNLFMQIFNPEVAQAGSEAAGAAKAIAAGSVLRAGSSLVGMGKSAYQGYKQGKGGT